MDARRCRVAGRERPRADVVAGVVASGRDRDLSWMQAELRLRTLDASRERLGAELDRRS